MKHKILPIVFSALFLGSCSSAYKSMQTPDDIYYSPSTGAEEKEVAKTNKQNDRYEDYVNTNESRYMRMKAHNYSLWNSLDDYNYWNDSRYDFSSCAPSRYDIWARHNSYGYNNYGYYYGYNNYNGWGGYYSNPLVYVIGYKNPKTGVGYNSGSYLNAYKNVAYNNTNYNPKTSATANGSSFGSLVRQVFSGSSSSGSSSSSSNTSWDRPARTFSSSTTSSSSSSSPTPPATSSSAGGNSGGYGSTGSSSSAPRATRQ